MVYEFYANSEHEFKIYEKKIGQKIWYSLGKDIFRATVMSAIDDKIVLSLPDDKVMEFLIDNKEKILGDKI